jgi:hypothetical protein
MKSALSSKEILNQGAMTGADAATIEN